MRRKKINSGERKRSFFIRSFFVVLVLILLFSAVILWTNYYQINKTMRANVLNLDMVSLRRSGDLLDEAMKQIRELVYTISKDKEVMRFGTSQLPQSNDIRGKMYDQLVVNLTDQLPAWRKANPYVETVSVYSQEQDKMILSGRAGNAEHVMDEAWKKVYRAADQNGKTNGRVAVFFHRRYGQYPYLISVLCPTYSLQMKKTGAVTLDMNVEDIGNVVVGPMEKGESFFIVDDTGKLYMSYPYSFLAETEYIPDELTFLLNEERYSGIDTIRETKYVISSVRSNVENWRYISVRPYHYYNQFTASGQGMIRDMLFLVIGLGIILILLLTYHSVRPISRLMHTIEPSDNHAAGRKGLDEVERIISSVQNIQSENKRMRSELDERLQELSEEQVRALQSQMDPHFLYNALDTIKWMALEEGKGETELSKMAESLADLFRLSLSRSDYVVPLKDEIHHVELYMKVYERRSHGKLHIHYDIPPEMLERKVVKLSIQPIVDNAVKHGLRPKRYCGNIHLSVYKKENSMIIQVENDGCMLSDEEVKNMNDRLSENAEVGDEHVGLPNVNRRIKLIYGEKYGVYMEKTNKAMRTCMKIPWE